MLKMKFFNKKWQVVGRPEFSYIFLVNLTTLAQFTGLLLFGNFLKDFLLLYELVIKDIFCQKEG